MTDPVEQVGDFLACSFRAHRPSVANTALDVLITLSGRRPADDARELAVIEMVQDAVSESMAVPQPAFHTAFLPADRPGHDLGAVGGTKNVPDLISFLDDSPPGRTYDHAIILDAHACALSVGWLDVVLAPLLRYPGVLLSGPPPKDCHARSKTPACHETNATVRPTAGSLTVRLSSRGRALLGHARHSYGDLPFSQAIVEAAKDRGIVPADTIFANPRLLALDAPVDESLFNDAAYYGLEAQIALVHVPRSLRVPGSVALAARLNLLDHRGRLGGNQPAIVIVLPPAGVPNMQSLILSTWTSFLRAGFPPTSLAFIACSRQGLVEASSLAVHQVLATSPGQAHANPCSGGAILEAIASLVHAGVHSMLITGLDSVATGSARAVLASLQKKSNAHTRPTFYLQPGEEAPMRLAPPTSSPSALLNVGATFVTSLPGQASCAEGALLAWATALNQGSQLSRTALEAVLSPMVAVSRLPDAHFAWGSDRHFLAVLHNGDPRTSETAFVYSTGFVSTNADVPLADWAASMVFRHRMMGQWRAGPGPICATYSAVSHNPLLLDSPRAVSRAVRRVGAFLVFARTRQLDCAVFPGFVLGSPHGPVVPFDAVLDKETVHALAGPGLVLYPRLVDMGATADGFVPFQKSPRGGEGVVFRRMQMLHTRRSQHGAPLSRPDSVQEGDIKLTAMGRFSMSGSEGIGIVTPAEQLQRSLVHAIQNKIDTLIGGNLATALTCTRDDRRRTASETALLALDGGIAHLATILPRLSSGRPVFLTGLAWRQAAGIIEAESIAAGIHDWAPDFQVLSAVDIDLDGSSASAAWAPVIEFIVCKAAAATTGLPHIDLQSILSRPLEPAAIVSRLAMHLPPRV